MSESLKIAWITAELTPFVKIGGLADVSAALPKALQSLGHDIKIVLPYYGTIKDEFEIVATNISYEDYEGKECNLYMTKLPQSNIQVFLLEHESFYGAPYDESHDLGEKFTTFSWLTTRLFDYIRWYPDIIHVNDWHTAIIPVLVKDIPVKTVLTIHNLAFQGVELAEHILRFGITDLETYENGKSNYMKLGIQYSDQVTTVSHTYAKEIMTEEYGFGLEKALQDHPREVKGIVHGIDLDEYNPSSDEFLRKNYDIDSLDDKSEDKKYLQNQANLPDDEEAFVIGLVSRLYEQKGVNLLIDILPELLELNIQCIILGTGDKDYEKELQRLEYAYMHKLKIFMMYNVSKSHEIFAGVDAFLVPSRFEPCGLTQLYSMAYGTVPIVRKTGGLADTVIETDNNEQTGFVFEDFTSDALKHAIIRAYTIYNENQIRWRMIQENGLKQDLSWTKPASEWIDIYRSLLNDNN